jgi:hypothetical protein
MSEPATSAPLSTPEVVFIYHDALNLALDASKKSEHVFLLPRDGCYVPMYRGTKFHGIECSLKGGSGICRQHHERVTRYSYWSDHTGIHTEVYDHGNMIIDSVSIFLDRCLAHLELSLVVIRKIFKHGPCRLIISRLAQGGSVIANAEMAEPLFRLLNPADPKEAPVFCRLLSHVDPVWSDATIQDLYNASVRNTLLLDLKCPSSLLDWVGPENVHRLNIQPRLDPVVRVTRTTPAVAGTPSPIHANFALIHGICRAIKYPTVPRPDNQKKLPILSKEFVYEAVSELIFYRASPDVLDLLLVDRCYPNLLHSYWEEVQNSDRLSGVRWRYIRSKESYSVLLLVAGKGISRLACNGPMRALPKELLRKLAGFLR